MKLDYFCLIKDAVLYKKLTKDSKLQIIIGARKKSILQGSRNGKLN